MLGSGDGSARSGSIRPAGCGRAGSEGSAGSASGSRVSGASASSLRAACGAPFPPVRRRRSSSATSSSSELECVFLSATPSSGNRSRMTLGLTSSSRASSLMRIFPIHSRPGAVLAPSTMRFASPPSGIDHAPGCSVFSIVTDPSSAAGSMAGSIAGSPAVSFASSEGSPSGAAAISAGAASAAFSTGAGSSNWP